MNQANRLEALADAVIPEAIEWVKELRAYRENQGKDVEYLKKAKIGVGVVGGAIRLCATIENSRTNDTIEARTRALEAGANSESPKQISGAPGS